MISKIRKGEMTGTSQHESYSNIVLVSMSSLEGQFMN